MTGVRWESLVLLAVCVACQPLDRRDGSLVISLVRAPFDVDAIEVTVRAGGRTFSEVVPRPSDDRITAFSAVPAGPAELDLRLFASGQLVEKRLGIAVMILEDTTVALEVNFESGPDFEFIEPVEGEPHVLRGGDLIPVRIRLVNSDLEVEVTATVDDRPIEVFTSQQQFGATIDASLAGDLLPATLLLKVKACLVRVPNDCIEKERAIVVTRAPWRIEVANETLGRPKLWGDKVVLVDGAGAVRVVTATSGEYRSFPILLNAAITEDVALVGDTVHATAENGRVFTVDLIAGTTEFDSLEATSAPVAWMDQVIVAADTELKRLSDGATIGTLPRRVRAAPLFDENGIVAADIVGNVLALDAQGAQLFSVNVGAQVFAQPVRYLGRIAIATSAHQIVQLDPISGAEVVPRIDLMRPLAFAPVAIGDRLIAAADDKVVFIAGDRIEASVALGGTITSVPVAWNGAVIVGQQNGLVRRVTDAGSRIIERVEGAALSALVIDSLGADRGTGIAVVGSRGDFAMLEPEEGF